MPVADKPWCVYVIACRGGGLYTGITPDPVRRYARHQDGKGALYTRLNPPEALLGCVWFASRREAAMVERRIKQLKPDERRAWLLAGQPSSPASPAMLAGVPGSPVRSAPSR